MMLHYSRQEIYSIIHTTRKINPPIDPMLANANEMFVGAILVFRVQVINNITVIVGNNINYNSLTIDSIP